MVPYSFHVLQSYLFLAITYEVFNVTYKHFIFGDNIFSVCNVIT